MATGPIDASGLIPTEVATEIISVAQQQSAVLALARTVPMPSGVTQLPVQTSIPKAAWLTGAGARKPYTDMGFEVVTMTAEEIAAVISIPQSVVADSAINLWNYVRPSLAGAIATGIDEAILFGTGAPATFPAGGITAAAYSQDADVGDDVLETVNNAMGLVETQGLPVTGSAADLIVRASLRGIRDSNGALLLGPAQIAGSSMDSLYGVPIHWSQFPAGETTDFITGDWEALVVGIRQDITYDLTDSGVIADAGGLVTVSAFQDDMVLMRVYARYGCVVVNPPTPRVPAGAKPFATATLATTPGP